MPRLTDAELHTYRTEGRVTPRRRVPAARLQDRGEALGRLIAENPRVQPEHLVLRWGGESATLPTHAAFREYARVPDVLDLVSQVIGPDVILWGAIGHDRPYEVGVTD